MFQLLLFLLFFLSPPPLSLSLNQDGLFLLKARRQLSDPNNSLSSWNSRDATPCRWRGVTCDPVSGAVTTVKLINASLSGSFPASFCRLPSLSFLILSYNLINSTLSGDAVAGCRSLRHLDLSQNALVGLIPDTLSQITTLESLDLSSNNLSGDIPATLATLPHLETLILVYNLFNGTIPNFLGNITSLKDLQLAYNSFKPGPLPSEFGNLTNLENLWLAQCNLVGPIPHSLGNLARLTNLDLSANRLTGSIPQSFTRLKRVNQIELYQNSLSSELPTGMSNMTNLRLFDASMNELTGTIPDELSELPLASLNLYENNLEGSLPASIARSPNLYELKLFTNGLVGTLPSDLGSNSPLNHIDVSNNKFTGGIPANLCRRGQLEQFILMYNSFSGEIHENFGNCKSLKRVRLRNNNLSGTVPEAFWGLPHLELLELLENSLSGHISNAISGAYKLSSLLLSNNRFSGSIPDEFGLLNGLLKFAASHNDLSGRIPQSMSNLGQLVNLDLSYNQLSGDLFGGIGHWTKLTELNLANNKFDGKIPRELGSLSLLNSLDLSLNNFSGEIPLQLQNLKLSEMNLSYNHLSGVIPPLYANDKYKMSFVGNPGLCGYHSGLCYGSGKSKNRSYVWILWSIFVIAGVVFIVGVVWFYLKCRKVRKLKKGFSTSRWRSFHKLGFSEFEVAKLLNEDNVIGSGASGKVYKVVLSNGEVVAVKKLWGVSASANENVASGKDEFEAEVETLGRIRHKNIVKLWCCCNNGDHRLLVYEYMPNGSLADVLKGCKKNRLDWPTRYKIAIDAAEGLSYLHHDCVPPIVHRDVKSNNILLDGEFVAKLADFGVAKMVTGASQGAESMSVIAGSYGYIAPEYAYTLRVNEKSDIYSFGVVILELVTGRPPIDPEYGENDLVKWVSSALENEGMDHVIDPTLDSKYMEEISKVLNVALHCTSSLPISRPTMRNVVKMLQEVTTAPKYKNTNDDKVSSYHEGPSYSIREA
ncbi:receptor-like protein kinase HSL1 [Abrus precatorius]|uniref:non-specific serine/threonine protein kinase n=1 Tax=Abrus precatorius TaxID=3816 RepID=A0A8B8KRL1_ABRPR|nr:receptor-like protein kinase HSL1 [Abrus precatorius]